MRCAKVFRYEFELTFTTACLIFIEQTHIPKLSCQITEEIFIILQISIVQGSKNTVSQL